MNVWISLREWSSEIINRLRKVSLYIDKDAIHLFIIMAINDII